VAANIHIAEQELVQLALDLCNIDSPPGKEGPVGDYVMNWLQQNGIRARKIGMFPERFNVLGTLPGSGNGYSLIFNSHMDTGKFPDDKLGMREAGKPVHHSAWRDGDDLVGEGIVNDKGPLAACMMATKAVMQSGVKLKGDLMVSAVSGEIGQEPVDEFEAPKYLSKEVGARYLIQHGGVADFALVAEGTGFDMAWVEAGKAFFKVTIFGDAQFYAPMQPVLGPSATHPNAIVRAGVLIPALQEWGVGYTKRFTYHGKGGTIEPKVTIGAVRGGNPWFITRTSELCMLYVDVRTIPNQDPLAIRQEMLDLMKSLGIPGEVELFVYRRSYEAEKPERLVESIKRVHKANFKTEAAMAKPFVSSMWRDLLPFNEMGIPAITYGPARSISDGFKMSIDNLKTAAQVYAEIAIDLCSQEKPK
jgi:acetylornithine deacetylase/succinyl-diaminopimelate desuccinylase-like protein